MTLQENSRKKRKKGLWLQGLKWTENSRQGSWSTDNIGSSYDPGSFPQEGQHTNILLSSELEIAEEEICRWDFPSPKFFFSALQNPQAPWASQVSVPTEKPLPFTVQAKDNLLLKRTSFLPFIFTFLPSILIFLSGLWHLSSHQDNYDSKVSTIWNYLRTPYIQIKWFYTSKSLYLKNTKASHIHTSTHTHNGTYTCIYTHTYSYTHKPFKLVNGFMEKREVNV